MTENAFNPEKKKTSLEKKLLIGVFVVLPVLGGLMVFNLMQVSAESRRIQDKFQQVMTGINDVIAKDGNPVSYMQMLDEIAPLMAKGNRIEAIHALDDIIFALGDSAKQDPSRYLSPKLPDSGPAEAEPALPVFSDIRAVIIEGYKGSAMHPALSADGNTLFFTGKEKGVAQSRILYATKADQAGLVFRYAGVVEQSEVARDSAMPSVDEAGALYFSSDRLYPQTLNSLYRMPFSGSTATAAPRALQGDLAAQKHGQINRDGSISADGRTYYYTRQKIFFGQPVPLSSDLAVAYFRGDDEGFVTHSQSDLIMREINTPMIEESPSATGDGLNLFFIRASQSRVSGEGKPDIRIMMAQRSALTKPFAKPVVLRELGDAAGGPHISADGAVLYYHRMIGPKGQLFRAVRAQTNGR